MLTKKERPRFSRIFLKTENLELEKTMTIYHKNTIDTCVIMVLINIYL